MRTRNYLTDVLIRSLEYYLVEENKKTEFVTEQHKANYEARMKVADNYLKCLKEADDSERREYIRSKIS